MEPLSNCMTPEVIAKINHFIDENFPYQDAKFVFQDPKFRDFFVANISPEIRAYIKPESYIVLRMIKPRGGVHAYDFHFDNYAQTILVPLMTPDAHQNGDLLLRHHTRGAPRFILMHIWQKFLFQNTLALKLWSWLATKERFFRRVRVKPGSALVFDGSRSLHGNMPVQAGERRSVLIHNQKLFSGSKAVEWIEGYSQYRKQKAQ